MYEPKDPVSQYSSNITTLFVFLTDSNINSKSIGFKDLKSIISVLIFLLFNSVETNFASGIIPDHAIRVKSLPFSKTLGRPIGVINSLNVPMPYSAELEDKVIPNIDRALSKIKELFGF